MNEIRETYFQIKPDPDRDWDRTCVFMNRGLRLNDVAYVSDIESWELTTHYRFTVHFYNAMPHSPMHFDFSVKAKAVKAQREFLRAWTRTGEYTYVDKTRPEPTAGQEIDCRPSVEDLEAVH